MIVRVGTGLSNLTSASTAVFLDVLDLGDGGGIVSYPLPVAPNGSQLPFTLAGNGASPEGVLSISENGQFVSMGGWSTPPGKNQVASSDAGHVIARITLSQLDGGGTGIDTSTAVSDAYALAQFRSVVTVDGTAFWTAGAASGVRYVVFGSAGATSGVYIGAPNMKAVQIFGGQLYASEGGGQNVDADAGVSKIYSVGINTPTTPSSVTYLPGIDLGDPNEFTMHDLNQSVAGFDALYSASQTSSAGIRNYVFNGTWWYERPALVAIGSVACQHLATRAFGATVVVLCSTSSAIYRVDDFGNGSTSAITTFATAAANTAYRGLVILP